MTPFLLALVSEPAPAGRSSGLGIAIILLCLAAAVVAGLFAAFRRCRGGCGCPGCGAEGASGPDGGDDPNPRL